MEYPSNSDKSKKEAAEERPRLQSVVKGNTETRKRGMLQKVIGTFVQEDKENLKEYILQDVIVPTIKDTMLNTLSMILYGDTRAGSSAYKSSLQKKGLNTKVSYRSAYEEAHRTREDRKPGYDYDEIIFRNRGDAQVVLDGMFDAIGHYKILSIFDMYDLAGQDAPYTYRDYGWTNIDSARIVNTKGGYRIELPRPLPLR